MLKDEAAQCRNFGLFPTKDCRLSADLTNSDRLSVLSMSIASFATISAQRQPDQPDLQSDQPGLQVNQLTCSLTNVRAPQLLQAL